MIRLAQSVDLETIREIWNYYILHTSYNYDYEAKTKEQIESWFYSKQERGFPVFVLEDDGKVQGYGSYDLFRPHSGYLHSAEHGLYFSPTSQGRGYGKKLMNHLINSAKEKGFTTFVAGIDSSNKGSLIFHERMGFKEVARFEKIGYKNKEWLDCIFMQKQF